MDRLPLGQAGMMTFELIPVGPLWPLALQLHISFDVRFPSDGLMRTSPD